MSAPAAVPAQATGERFSLARPLARRVRFYYGWVVVMVAGLISFAGVAESPAIIGIFFKEMSAEFDWSRTLVSGAVLAGTGLAAVAAPIAGPLVDRYGPRIVLAAAALGMSVCLIALGSTTSAAMFYVLMALGFAFNATNGRVGVNAVVAQWFVRRRGRAAAMVNVMLGLGFVVLPIVGAYVLERWGWRAGWRVLGVATLVLAVPPGLLLLLRHPSDVGQRVDGDRADTSASGQAPSRGRTATAEVQWTAREAARTPTFWMLTAALVAQGVATAGQTIHVIPHLLDRGFDPTTAALIFSVAGLTMVPSSLFWGWLLDRLPVRHVFVLVGALVVCYTVLVVNAHSAWTVMPMGIAMGLGFGGFGMVQRVIYANYFGRRSAGAVLGLVTPFVVVAQGLGTLAAGVIYDVTTSYTGAFALFILMVVMSMALILAVPAPRKREAVAGAAPAG